MWDGTNLNYRLSKICITSFEATFSIQCGWSFLAELACDSQSPYNCEGIKLVLSKTVLVRYLWLYFEATISIQCGWCSWAELLCNLDSPDNIRLTLWKWTGILSYDKNNEYYCVDVWMFNKTIQFCVTLT